MTKYRISASGEDYIPKVAHNIEAWTAIRKLFEKTAKAGGFVPEDSIQRTLRRCLHTDGLSQEGRFLRYAVRRGWLESA